jgi:hypothetical protein
MLNLFKQSGSGAWRGKKDIRRVTFLKGLSYDIDLENVDES